MRVLVFSLWLALPLAGYGVYNAYGAPHLLWSTTFKANGSRYDLSVPRHYTSCTYVGWGPRTVTVPPRKAKCPWVRMFKDAD